jgi:hypothetical protein
MELLDCPLHLYGSPTHSVNCSWRSAGILAFYQEVSISQKVLHPEMGLVVLAVSCAPILWS